MRLDEADLALMWDMIHHAELAVSFVEKMTIEQYLQEPKTRLAVERALEIIGEAANDLSEQARAAAPAVPWRKIIDQRHVLAHAYDEVDHLRIWEVATQRLPELLSELRRIVGDATSEKDADS